MKFSKSTFNNDYDSERNEVQMEPLVEGIARRRFIPDPVFLKACPTKWTPRTENIYTDVSWVEMKQNHKWGYLNGSIMHSMVTWLYVRPDIFAAIGLGDQIKSPSELIKKGILNVHYFATKTKAIEFFKNAARELKIHPNVIESTNNSFKDHNEFSFTIANKRGNIKMANLIDCEAIVDRPKKKQKSKK